MYDRPWWTIKAEELATAAYHPGAARGLAKRATYRVSPS
jgi:hypothetical protein